MLLYFIVTKTTTHYKMQNNIAPITNNILAAVDLGSNSFHMIVARVSDDGSLQIIDRIKEMVRLGAGLDDENNLMESAQQKALDCLERFGQRLQDITTDNVRVVGTNTLRKAKNSAQFIQLAQEKLGHSIHIISGIEEARLVYLGVSHTVATSNDKKRLVIDIGGGSTETIIGSKFNPILMESLFMGCVSITKKFFSDGSITKKQLKKADIFARQELERISFPFTQLGWSQVIGTSGSIRSIANVIREEQLEEEYKITHTAMQQIKKQLIAAKTIGDLQLKGLSQERHPVFIGGFVVLNAIIKSLHITEITISEGALREGLLYDLIGRINHEDTREITIKRMTERYSIQTEHVKQIAHTANTIYKKISKDWGIFKSKYENILRWASLLHEIGLTIAHAGYHKHGAYLTKNSDMPGFTFQDQQFLAALIYNHRQKYDIQQFEALPFKSIEPAKRIAIILRLAIILHRSRGDVPVSEINFKVSKDSLKIIFPENWLEAHTLTYADLLHEKDLLEKINFTLKLK